MTTKKIWAGLHSTLYCGEVLIIVGRTCRRGQALAGYEAGLPDLHKHLLDHGVT
jgi:hypothetical protein